MSVVLITGCSTGIGRALARVCADAGDTVFATMRDTAFDAASPGPEPCTNSMRPV